MTVRATMAQLITKTRRLISDINAPQTFTDQEIQDELDRTRVYARFVPLKPEPFFAPGGLLHFHDYFIDLGDWESDAVLYDNAFNPILSYPTGTLVDSDYISGHWTFADNPAATPIPMPLGQIPVVRLIGQTYDLWSTAAELLEFKAATLDTEFDFSTNQQSFRRSQQFDMIMKLAQMYKGRARPQIAQNYREDQIDASYLPANQWFGGYSGT